jgi:hypothetical protein
MVLKRLATARALERLRKRYRAQKLGRQREMKFDGFEVKDVADLQIGAERARKIAPN